MIISIFIILIMMNFLCLIFNRNSKIVLIISAFLLCIIMGGAVYTGDYENYYLLYTHNINAEAFEEGFLVLIDLFKNIGLNYKDFILVLFIILNAINFYVIKKFTNNIHIVLLMYSVCQLVADVTQYRNFIASTILMIAIYLLFNNKRILAFIIILFSCMFHRTMFFYIPLVFINYEKKHSFKMIRNFSIIVFSLCLIMFFLGNNLTLLKGILYYFSNDNMLQYFGSRTNFGFIIFFLMHVANLLLLFACYKIYGETKLLRFTLILDMYLILSFPLIMVNVNLYRLFRNISLLNYICIANVMDNFTVHKVSTKYYSILFCAILYTFSFYSLYKIQGTSLYEFVLSDDNNVFIGGER